MKKFLLLFLAVLLIVALAVPAFASGDELSYNGHVLPVLPEPYHETYTNALIYNNGYNYWLVQSHGQLIYDNSGKFASTVTGFASFRIKDGVWKYSSDAQTLAPTLDFSAEYLVWASYDVFASDGSLVMAGSSPRIPVCDGTSCPATDVNKDNVCDDCGMPFSVPRDYSPFTVKKFMNHIGQILTYAVSWVGNVGSTILQQPLLLAFTALPLCGLGIAVFRRLKNTV